MCVVDCKAWPRPTSEVLAGSGDSTPPRKWPPEGKSRVFGPYGIRQAQPCGQVRSQNSILCRQVLVLEEQFLVHQPRYIRQQTSPMIAVHANRPSSQVSDFRAVRVF